MYVVFGFKPVYEVRLCSTGLAPPCFDSQLEISVNLFSRSRSACLDGFGGAGWICLPFIHRACSSNGESQECSFSVFGRWSVRCRQRRKRPCFPPVVGGDAVASNAAPTSVCEEDSKGHATSAISPSWLFLLIKLTGIILLMIKNSDTREVLPR